jgi:phosphopantetheine adenylyltransferase
MKIYQSAMQDALNNNMDVNVGLNTVRTKVQEGLKKYRRYNFGDIERDIVRIQSDNLIQSNVKEKFNDLKSNFEEIQDYVDNPRGNYESYSKKIVEFTDNYKKTSKTMKVLLGIELNE